ncbi:MAG: 50S ribosomal protein L17 [bacterium]|nr:50S ribosomal protein L17 [bacterium]
MRHRNKGRILQRKKGPRVALLRSLLRSLILHKAIVTTTARAKEIRPRVEKLVTRAKTGTLANHRYITGEIGLEAAKKLRDDIAPNSKDRKGGYTRIVKHGVRKSDAAQQSHISFVD